MTENTGPQYLLEGSIQRILQLFKGHTGIFHFHSTRQPLRAGLPSSRSWHGLPTPRTSQCWQSGIGPVATEDHIYLLYVRTQPIGG